MPEDDADIQYSAPIVERMEKDVAKDWNRRDRKPSSDKDAYDTPAKDMAPARAKSPLVPKHPPKDGPGGGRAPGAGPGGPGAGGSSGSPELPRKDGYFTPTKEDRHEPQPAQKETVNQQEKSTPLDDPKSKEFLAAAQEAVEMNRKIIRTGEMDFEIDSYEVAVVNITRLIVQIKGAFISDSKSGQLKNGKLQGYVIVRMPPQFLDQFILDLRRDLGKIGELKTQRINSQDVTKQYTDIESALKAARTMEERLLNIIKTGKGEIKDLITAENALGEWRTKIEKMEGEMRYYSNQVSLSTLTISLAEREPPTPFALVATESVSMRIEAEDVKKGAPDRREGCHRGKGTRAALGSEAACGRPARSHPARGAAPRGQGCLRGAA